MAHDVIHISEKEAASDFAAVLASVRAGAEVVIESESGKLPVAVVHLPVPPRRSISECIALLPEDSTAVMDADFAKDVQQLSRATANRQPPLFSNDPRPEDRFPVSNSPFFRYRFRPHAPSLSLSPGRNT